MRGVKGAEREKGTTSFTSEKKEHLSHQRKRNIFHINPLRTTLADRCTYIYLYINIDYTHNDNKHVYRQTGQDPSHTGAATSSLKWFV